MIRLCAAQAEENSYNSAFSPINTTEAPQITLVFTSKRILYMQVHICSYKWMTNVLHHTTGSEMKTHLCHFQPITPNNPYVLFIDILPVYQSTTTGHQCTKNGRRCMVPDGLGWASRSSQLQTIYLKTFQYIFKTCFLLLFFNVAFDSKNL